MSLYKNTMDQITLDEHMQEKLKGLYQNEALSWDYSERQQAEKHRIISFGHFAVAAASVAACAVVALAAYAGNAEWRGEEELVSDNSTSFGEKRTETVSEYEHTFTLKALMSDRDVAGGVVMEKGKPVFTTGTWDGGSYGQKSSESDEISYRFGFKFLCEGAHIEKITYSVNKGVLQICEPRDVETIAIVTESQLAPYEDYGVSIHTDDDVPKYRWNDMNNQVYYSYTVAYDKQTAPYTDFGFCGETNLNDVDIEGLRRPEGVTWAEYQINDSYVNAMRQMVGDTVITCMVHYDDGTTETADIKVVPKVMTLGEAGLGERYPEMSKEDLETRHFFIAYELQ